MKTLKKLVKAVKEKVHEDQVENVLELKSLLKKYRGNDWSKYLSREKSPQKTNVLFQDEEVKIVLIYWNGYEKTKKHGHPNGGGLFKVLSGTLKETRFDINNTERITGTYDYFKGELAYIHDSEAYHIVENPIPYPAISLHVYVSGIYSSETLEADTSIHSIPDMLKVA